MGRYPGCLGVILAATVAGLVGLAGLALAAEEAAPTSGGVAEALGNPVPDSLPFRVSGEMDLGVQQLEGNRNSPNFHTYRVIEDGFVVNGLRLGLETKDQRHFIQFQGQDISKDDQRYEVSAGQYGRYRFDFGWDQIPHVYATDGRTPYTRSDGGVYTLPPGVAGSPLASLTAAFNNSPAIDLKTRNDVGKTGIWWTPSPEWDLQVTFDHTRRAGTRPMGGGFGDPDGPDAIVVELPEPIQRHTDQVNATAGYSTEGWQLQGGYRFSLFHNDIRSMTYDNPVFDPLCGNPLFAPDTCAVPQGRTALAPDNQSHDIFLAGGVNLPMATRLSAKVAYGINRQNDPFLDHTINPLLVGTPGLELNSPSLHGDVRKLMTNVTGTTRPFRNVTVTASYRLYDKNDRTPIQSFGATVVRDTLVDTGKFGRIFDYMKQNGDLDVAWRIRSPLTFRAGVGWERWDRPDTREVRQTNEYSGRAGLTYRPVSWLTWTGRYQRSWKRTSEYDPFTALSHLLSPADFLDSAPAGQSPMLRKFDEAARDRHKAETSIRAEPLKGLSLGTTLAFAQDRYPFTPLGLQNSQDWSGTFHVGYTPVSWLTLRAHYTLDEYRERQRSRSRPQDPTGTAQEFPDFDWVSRNRDTYDTVGAGAVIRIVPERLELQTDYTYQRSLNRVHSFNPTTPSSGASEENTNATASDFPDDRFTLQRVSVILRYWVLKNLTLRLGYTYERFHEAYWQTDFLQQMNNPALLSLLATSGGPDFTPLYDTFLGGRPFKSYEAHIVGFGLTYGF